MPSLPFLSPSRCVLVIGDEALYLYETDGSKTRLIETVLWATQELENAVVDAIRREFRGKPVVIMNDMTDQHFKGGQRMPKVGAMDRANVIARKLNVAFPNDPIRGALEIKDKAIKATVGAAGGVMYLFAAVPMSDPVSKTLSALKKTSSAIGGFVLLPVESSDMVKSLAEKAMKREKTKSRWAIMIGQHMGGGLRQVIIRNGQLAMTRMTPVADLDNDPEAWINEVTQEFKATISYLSRFGYAPEDGTEVFVIAPSDVGQELGARIDSQCNYTSYTVNEAADVLGIRIGAQADQYHTDPLHVAWMAQKSRFLLPMESLDITKIYGPRRAAMGAIGLMFLSAAYMAWSLLTATQSWIETSGQLTVQKAQQTKIEAEYQSEVARMDALGVNVKLIQSSLKSFKALEADGLHPLPLFKIIGQALGPELRLDKLVMNRIGNVALGLPPADPTVPPATDLAAAPSTFEAILTLSFPATLDPEVGVKQVNDLSRRLTAALPATYKTIISKQVADLIYTENTAGEAGATDKDVKKENFKAELTIRGPLK